MAISNATVVPIVYAAALFQVYRSKRVYADLLDRRYEGLLVNGGDRVRVSRIVDASVADYAANQSSAITYTAADAAAVADIVLDKFKYWAIKLDDIHAAISNADLLGASVETAGIALAEQIDSDVYALWSAATSNDGTSQGLADFTLDHDVSGGLSLADLKLPQIQRFLDNKNLPREGRFLVIGPYTMEILQGLALQQGSLNAPYNAELRNGRIGQYAGLEIIVASDRNITVSSNQGTEKWFYGNRTAYAMIEEIRRVESLRLQTHFQDAVRGLFGYGMKRMDTNRLFHTDVTIDNIPA